MVGASHIFCLENSIFLCIRYCYCIVDVGSGGIGCFLYYMIFFCWVIGVVRSGSARTLYLDDELWNRLMQLVKLGYARNVSQLVNRLLADALGVVGRVGPSTALLGVG